MLARPVADGVVSEEIGNLVEPIRVLGGISPAAPDGSAAFPDAENQFMSTDLSWPGTLQEADFHRLGLRRQEYRLEVIRRAATGRATALIQKQRQTPSLRDQEQLSRLATSTYRLLDPRQRDQVSQRVHIGRVLRPEQLDEQMPRFAPQREVAETSNSLTSERAVAAGWNRRLTGMICRVSWSFLGLCCSQGLHACTQRKGWRRRRFWPSVCG